MCRVKACKSVHGVEGPRRRIPNPVQERAGGLAPKVLADSSDWLLRKAGMGPEVIPDGGAAWLALVPERYKRNL